MHKVSTLLTFHIQFDVISVLSLAVKNVHASPSIRGADLGLAG